MNVQASSTPSSCIIGSGLKPQKWLLSFKVWQDREKIIQKVNKGYIEFIFK